MTKKEKEERILELQKLIEIKKEELVSVKKMANMLNANQLAMKLIMNSSYGCFANKHFVCFTNAVASSITAHGRNLIQTMESSNEKYWYDLFHDDKEFHLDVLKFQRVLDYIDKNNLKRLDIITDDKVKKADEKIKEIMDKLDFSDLVVPEIEPIDGRYIRLDTKEYVKKPLKSEIYITGEVRRVEPVSAYCDTDSVDAKSILRTEKGMITIEDYYNDCFNNKKDIIEDDKGHEIILCDNSRTILNYNNGKLYDAKVKKVIRHKVKKEKWLIRTSSGKEIFVTNDHSMVVFRNNEQIVIKPYDILKTDKILSIKK